MYKMAENRSNTAATEQELNTGGRSIEDTDDSVFYREDEDVPQQVLDTFRAPRSGETILQEKLYSAPLPIYISESQATCQGAELKEGNSECDGVAMLQKMKSKMDNEVNNESPTDTDVYNKKAATGGKITHAQELSVPLVVPLGASNPAKAARMKEKDETSTDESSCFKPDGSGDTGLPLTSVEEVQEEHGLEMICNSANEPFYHLMHAKYGTVSYRRIRRGQTRKRIEMFESMMQL